MFLTCTVSKNINNLNFINYLGTYFKTSNNCMCIYHTYILSAETAKPVKHG